MITGTWIDPKPFVPFRMTLTECSSYEVRHPELCMVGRRSAIIGLIAMTLTGSSIAP